ncbi:MULTISPECIES: hypothetical protein [Streptomyces]|uniref:hypothetical protein n=1 Tax=Streptomyces TaxID=1883 RepID=UPI0009A507ED|nr:MULTISPECIES: hypothetical protein [Streptomyces]
MAADLAEQVARHGDEDLDGLINRLIRYAWPPGRYTDDTALLLLRTIGNEGPTAAQATEPDS